MPRHTRRTFLGRTAAGAAAAMAAPHLLAAESAAPVPAKSAADRPNILWISCEDTSPDLGCYGDAYARTPHLDRLAAQGARFTRAFTHAPVCAPSRSGLITGMYPTTIGTLHMRSQGVPPPYVKCFTEYLRAAGYYCTNDAKTDYNFPPPVTAWDECRKGAHWRHHAKGQPFFAVFNLEMSHESRSWAIDKPLEHDPAKAVLPPYYPDTPIVRRTWARCYDQVTRVDAAAARILADLEADGLADNTLVFFWGDHGRGLTRAKRWVYDSGIRVPLLVRWPGRIAPGTVREDLACFLDFAPTLLAVAGVDIPSYMQGQPILGPGPVKPREYVFAARDRMDETYDIVRGVRDKRFKYIKNFQPEKPYAQVIAYAEKMPILQEMRRLHAEGKLEGPPALFMRLTKPVEELYDTDADPHEIRNLADRPEHAETLKRMRGVLEAWMKETHDVGLVPEDELKERMRPGGVWQTTAAPALAPAGGTLAAGAVVTVACPTPGASIAWTTDEDADPHWNLYSVPVKLARSATLRVKACRLGYKDSPEIKAGYKVGG